MFSVCVKLVIRLLVFLILIEMWMRLLVMLSVCLCVLGMDRCVMFVGWLVRVLVLFRLIVSFVIFSVLRKVKFLCLLFLR